MTPLRITIGLLIFAVAAPVFAAQKIANVTRVKGQEPTFVHGTGLVVGLKGTGDKSDMKEVARMLQKINSLTGHPNVTEKDLAGVKNVAIVHVTATIPPQGARTGDTINCIVASTGSASSLKDGFLLGVDLVGPIPQSPENSRVFAKAHGLLTIEKTETPTIAKVNLGARMTADFRNPFIKDGCITLVLEKKHASFAMTTAIANAINLDPKLSGSMNTQLDAASNFSSRRISAEPEEQMARALDQMNVQVKIPYEYLSNPVEFVAEVGEVKLIEVNKVPKVVINERAGIIVIDQGVEIAPIEISHKGIVIQAAAEPAPDPGQPGPQAPQRFVNFDTESRLSGLQNPTLNALRDAMNELRIPTQDMIEVIRMIDEGGNLLSGEIEYR